jgi:hypothetical protein
VVRFTNEKTKSRLTLPVQDGEVHGKVEVFEASKDPLTATYSRGIYKSGDEFWRGLVYREFVAIRRGQASSIPVDLALKLRELRSGTKRAQYDSLGFKLTQIKGQTAEKFVGGFISLSKPVGQTGLAKTYDHVGRIKSESLLRDGKKAQYRFRKPGVKPGAWRTPAKTRSWFKRHNQPIIVAGLGAAIPDGWNADLHLLLGAVSDGAGGGYGLTVSKVSAEEYSVEASLGLTGYYALFYAGIGARRHRDGVVSPQLTAGVGIFSPMVFLRASPPVKELDALYQLGLSFKIPLIF